MAKKGMMVWVMSNKDADLLGETLALDSESHTFELRLRVQIEQALWRVEQYRKSDYDRKIIKEADNANL